MSELHKEQQQRIDDIVKKHFNYIDEFYDVESKKRTQKEHRKARQDMGLPAQKKRKNRKDRNTAQENVSIPDAVLYLKKIQGLEQLIKNLSKTT